jgi:hypothetical protein
VTLLEAITSTYELLDAVQRAELPLRIGRGAKLSYQRAFCRIEHYFAVPGRRIFHGGVSVRIHGPNFAIRFFDRVIRRDSGGAQSPALVSLYLKRELLQKHWNGQFLAAQLSAAAEPGHYAHCYFFGQLVAHPSLRERLLVSIAGLEHLAFTVRTTRQP